MALDFPLKPLARLYAQRYSPHLRYSPRHKRWLALSSSDGIWRPDRGASLKVAKELVNEAAQAAQSANMTNSANAWALLRCAAETEPAMSAKIPEKTNCARPGWAGGEWAGMSETQSAHADYSQVDPAFWRARLADR